MSATIRVDFLGDASSAKRAARETSTAVDRMGRDVETSARGVDRLGGSFGSALKKYGPLAAAAGGAALLKFGLDSAKAASDVEQAFGAVDAVFAQNSATVKRWAREAADDLGLAQSEYASLAAVTGAMLKNSGIEDYADQTDRLINLGADLAAQYGGTTKDAVEAIGSLFRGEADPIEKYAVSIKQADINARLAADGLDDLEGAAKTQAEAQARLALLFEKSADAQGAFSRESGTLAQNQQKLSANWENLQATIGEKFLPIASRVVGWLSDTVSGGNRTSEVLQRIGDIYGSYVTPILDGARSAWDRISEAVNDATGRSDGMAFVLDKVLLAAEKLAPFIGEQLGQRIDDLGKIISGTIQLAGFLAGAFERIGSFAGGAKDKVDDLRAALGRLPFDKLERLASFSPIGLLGGLLRSDDVGSLGRAGGGLVLGGGGSSTFNVAAPQVVVMIDGRALASSYVQVARRAARIEINKAVASAKDARVA